MHIDCHRIHPRRVAKATFFLLAGILASLATAAPAQVNAPTADLTDDGNVNILDVSAIGSRFGLQAGQAQYRGALDFNADGQINLDETSI